MRAGDVPTDRRFTGQRWDATIELYDYQARWYAPALGRFVQADTVVPEPGNPQSLNRYAYVLNNPLRHTDPSGHGATPGCEYEGCTLPAGLLANSTWALPNGAYAIVDPQLVAASDYNPLTEAVLPGAVMLVGVTAGGQVTADVVAWAGEAAWGQAVLRFGPAIQQTWEREKEIIYRAGQFVGKQLTREQVHDIGVVRGQAMAQAHEFESVEWQNPFANRGAFGQGFDDIMRAANGDWVIVEFRGGTSRLAGNQMTENWVYQNILRLRQAGDPMGDILREAHDFAHVADG